MNYLQLNIHQKINQKASLVNKNAMFGNQCPDIIKRELQSRNEPLDCRYYGHERKTYTDFTGLRK